MTRIEQTPATVLKRGRTLLAEVGWLQGRSGSVADGGYCAVGALNAAASDIARVGVHRDLYGRARRTLALVVCEDAELDVEDLDPFEVVTQWNDHDGRTVADVLAAFDQAIERSNT